MDIKDFRYYRKKKGLESKYVAELLMIEPRTLNKKERDNNFTNKQKAMLCKLYEIDDIEIVENLNKIN